MRTVARVVLCAVCVIAICVVPQFASSQDQSREVVRVKGSESTAWMVDAYAKEFMKNNANVNVVVAGGMGVGFQALMNKECDIAMSSRRMEPAEKENLTRKGIDAQEKLIGWGGIVIITNPANPVNEVTVEQARKMLSGQYTNWNELGGPDKAIAVLSIGDERPGTLYYIEHDFIKGPISPRSINKQFFRAVISGVAESDAATSFVRVRNILQLKQQGQETRVKVMAIKKDEHAPGVLPSRQTVDEGSYPITRPYYLYMDGNSATKGTRSFFEFCGGRNPRAI